MGACPSSDVANERPVLRSARSSGKKGLLTGCVLKAAGTGESCCAVVKRSGSRAQKLLASGLHGDIPLLPFSVCIIGGGAVGLSLALRLAEFPEHGPNLRREVHVTVYDTRWVEDSEGKFVWASSESGETTSQDTIVTVSTEVVNLFCEESEATLAAFAGDSVVPGSQDIALDALEARLLARVQEDDLQDIITLAIGPPDDVCQSVDESDSSKLLPESALSTYTNWVEMCACSHASSRHTLVVAADGTDSYTRRAFNEYFEWSSEDLVDDRAQDSGIASQFVLGVTLDEVEVPTQSRILSAALSRAQKRYHYGSADGKGYLSICLNPKEYVEVAKYICNGGNKVKASYFGESSLIHQAPIKTPHVLYASAAEGDLTRLYEKLPFLERVISEGAELLALKQASISSVVLSQVASGSSKAFHCAPPRSVKLCLLGDAAWTQSGWPGRGLESGLQAADALARVLHRGAPLSAYECFMDQLRRREKLVWDNSSYEQELRRTRSPPFQRPQARGLSTAENEEPPQNTDAVSRFVTNVKLWRDAIQGSPDEDAETLTDQDIEQRLTAENIPQTALESLAPPPPPANYSQAAFILALDAWAEMLSGRAAKAMGTCTEALCLEPDDALAIAIRCAIKLQLGLFEEVANEELTTFDELALWARAEAKVSMGQYEQAIDDCTKALEHSPGSVLCFTVRGEANLRLGRYAEAVEDCDATLEREPDQAVALAVRAEAKLNLGRLDEAVMDCDWALHHGLSASVLAVRGEAHRRNGKITLALADCNKALQLSPNHFNALSVRGEAYLDNGDINNALPDLDLAIQLARAAREKSLQSVQGSGSGTGDEAAVASSSMSAVSSPILAATLAARADALVRIARYSEAISDCNEALETDGQNSLAMAIRAEAKLRNGDPQAALGDCNLALTMEKHDAYTYIVRAEAYLCVNRPTDAMEDCDRALELNSQLDYGVAVRESAASACYKEVRVGQFVECFVNGDWFKGRVVALPADDIEHQGRWKVQLDIDQPGNFTLSSIVR